MQGDFTLQIHSKSDTFSTSKLLSVSEDVQLLWHWHEEDHDHLYLLEVRVHHPLAEERRRPEPTRFLEPTFGAPKMPLFEAPLEAALKL